MKKNGLLLFLLVSIFLLLNSQFIYANTNMTIDPTDINFDISPQNIDEDTYLPLNELEKIINLDVFKMSNNTRVINYEENHYILRDRKEKIIGNENLYLENAPLAINNKFLIPVEFITKGLKIKLVENDKGNDFNISKNAVTFKFLLEDKSLKSNSSNKISLLLANNSDSKKVFKFNTGQKFEIILEGKKGNVVYRWSRFVKFTQAKTSIILDPGKSKLYEVDLGLVNVKPGNYILYAYLVDGNKLKTQKMEVEIR